MGFNFACIRLPAIQMLRICGVAEVVAVAEPAQTQNDTSYRKNRKPHYVSNR